MKILLAIDDGSPHSEAAIVNVARGSRPPTAPPLKYSR